MKRVFIIGACCLCFVAIAVAESVTVEQGKKKETNASHNVRITVVLDGKPLKDAIVDFYQTANVQPLASVVTSDKGIVNSPTLPSGYYYVVATSKYGISAFSLDFHVSHGHKVTSFSVDLTNSYHSAEQSMAAAKRLPVSHKMQEFQGFVKDPSGAVIPDATIRVVDIGAKLESGIYIKSDARGHFSTQLANGIYIAFFSARGFRTETVPFEIDTQGEKEINVELRVGGVTESIAVT